ALTRLLRFTERWIASRRRAALPQSRVRSRSRIFRGPGERTTEGSIWRYTRARPLFHDLRRPNHRRPARVRALARAMASFVVGDGPACRPSRGMDHAV